MVLRPVIDLRDWRMPPHLICHARFNRKCHMSFRITLPFAVCASLMVPFAPPAAFAQQRLVATGVPSGPGGADAALFRAPMLDPLSLMMAYNRMNGTHPYFRPYAERTTAFVNSTTFDRPEVLAREIARLEGQFTSLDMNRVYLMRLGTQLRQYDTSRGGYPIGLKTEVYVPIPDPVAALTYGLQFRNIDEVAFVPVGDTTAARNFAQRHGFSTQYENAGDVTLEFAIRFAEAPPAVGGTFTTVRADILAARVVTRNGQPVWDFGPTAAGRGPTPLASTPGLVPVLKAADIQGISVGAPLEEGAGIASRAYPTQRWHSEQGGRWFRNIDPGAEPQGYMLNREMAIRCGTDPLSLNQAALRMQFDGRIGDEPVADASEACLGYNAPTGSGTTRKDTIASVVSGQRLPGATLDTVRSSLADKYGPPTYTRNGSRVLQWIGRDPLHPYAAPVSLTARIDPRPAGGVVLGMKAEPYVDPNPPKAPVSQGPTAPRL